jgi:hypothetical protein
MHADRPTDTPPAEPKGFGTRTNILLALTVCAVLTVLIGSAMFFVLPASLFGPKGSGGGGAENAASLTGGAELGPDDPTLRFAETGVGQVLFARGNADRCTRVLFDNRTGTSYLARDVFCGQKVEPVVQPDGTDRLTVVRRSFRR